MGLDKAIKYGKEHRKPYKGAKAVDATCRNHGSCKRCRTNRIYRTLKTNKRANYMLKESENKNDE